MYKVVGSCIRCQSREIISVSSPAELENIQKKGFKTLCTVCDAMRNFNYLSNQKEVANVSKIS